MTATTRPTARRRTVFGDDGTPIASIAPTRPDYLGTLLSECQFNHIYILPEGWPADDTGCPRCRALGLA